jgi:hypothetical protein
MKDSNDGFEMSNQADEDSRASSNSAAKSDSATSAAGCVRCEII